MPKDPFDAAEPGEELLPEGSEVEARIHRRARRYFAVIVPALVLVVFGFFVPAQAPFRIAALLMAALLLPVAAVLGNPVRFR